MTPEQLEKLKFPIGKFERPSVYTPELIASYVSEIEKFPARIREEVKGLSEQLLNTPYRPEGWTIRQVVHHCADSHMNAIIRFKITLTEDRPTIKPYKENLFAKLTDASDLEIEPSLAIIEGVHTRLAALIRSLDQKQLERIYIHPEYNKEFTLNEATGMYAWHSNHHLAHIKQAKALK